MPTAAAKQALVRLLREKPQPFGPPGQPRLSEPPTPTLREPGTPTLKPPGQPSPQPSIDETLALLREPIRSPSQMSHSELLLARKAATDPADQANLANFEHRAFAREYVADNPWAAPGMVLMAPGYAAAKALGFMKGRTKPSMDQVFAGIEGTGEGLVRAIRRARGKPEDEQE